MPVEERPERFRMKREAAEWGWLTLKADPKLSGMKTVNRYAGVISKRFPELKKLKDEGIEKAAEKERRKAVADVVGAIFLMLVILASSLGISFVTAEYFAYRSAYNGMIEHNAMFNQQNITVYYAEALPPYGNPGIVVANYGIPVEVLYFVSESNGALSFTPANKYLEHGQTTYFYTSNPDSGVMTGLGGLFMANSTPPKGMVPVSKMAINVSVSFPPELEYVPAGSGPWITYASTPVKWYVNGSFAGAGRFLEIPAIDGPTTITAVPVNSYPHPPKP